MNKLLMTLIVAIPLAFGMVGCDGDATKTDSEKAYLEALLPHTPKSICEATKTMNEEELEDLWGVTYDITRAFGRPAFNHWYDNIRPCIAEAESVFKKARANELLANNKERFDRFMRGERE